MKDTIKEILLKKKERIAFQKQALGEEQLKIQIASLAPTRPFIEAISKPRQLALIAEIKKASPSRGVIRPDFNHMDIAKAYQEAEVNAISVLTEEDFFLGNLSFINEVKSVTSVPILRKDFIFEPYQVYESRYFGSDAILLIADILTKDQIQELSGIASSLGMDSLVEVHTEKELKKVLSLKMPLVGINNRNLRTLEIDMKTTESLFILIPKGTIVVVESGIKTRQDMLFLKVLGVNAALVGEAIMGSTNLREKCEELMV